MFGRRGLLVELDELAEYVGFPPCSARLGRQASWNIAPSELILVVSTPARRARRSDDALGNATLSIVEAAAQRAL